MDIISHVDIASATSQDFNGRDEPLQIQLLVCVC